jgi:hypothetical protein
VALIFARNDRCPQCNPQGSLGQHQIADFIASLGLEVGRNVRGILGGRRELDVFVPAKQLAVEYNGLYWHSEAAGKDRFFHQDKWSACKNLDVLLLHVFEDEWLGAPGVVKGTLKRRLGMTSELAATQCSTSFLPAHEFFNDNLTSPVIGATTVSLVHDGRPVSSLTGDKDGKTFKVAAWTDDLRLVVDGSINALMSQACASTGCERASVTIDPRMGQGIEWSRAGWILAHVGDEAHWFTDGHCRKTSAEAFHDTPIDRVSITWGLRWVTYVSRA